MAIKHIENGNKTCIVVFSAYQINKNCNFTFYKNFEPYFGDYDFIFVLDEKNKWYNYKINELDGVNYKEISSNLNKILNNYESVSLIGSSMGGYASLLYSNLINVDYVTTIAPQVFLKEGWPRHSQSGLSNNEEVIDLTKLDKSNFISLEKINYFIGLDEMFDIYQALCFYGDGHKMLKYTTIVPTSFHNIALHFHKRGILDRFFKLFLDKKNLHGLSPYNKKYEYDETIIELILSPDFIVLINSYYQYFFNKSYNSAVNVAKILLKRAPNWLGLKRIYGLALYEAENFIEAANILQEVSASNDIDDIYYELSLSYFYLEEYDLMLDSYERSKKLNKGVAGKIKNKLSELLSEEKTEKKQKYIKLLESEENNIIIKEKIK